MIRLTQTIKGYDDSPIYVAPQHIVAIYRNRQGNGCHIELITSTNPDYPIPHVKESALEVAEAITRFLADQS